MTRRLRKSQYFNADHFVREEGIQVRGANEKDVLKDPGSGAIYIAKLGRRHNDLEVMTEYAIHVIGRSLGVSVADAMIATYRGKLRFFSRYFLDSSKPEELVHGVQLFQELFDPSTVASTLGNQLKEQAMFKVQAIKSAFGAHYYHYGPETEDELFCGFVSMITHDAIIGVQDRHHENWGVIVHREVHGERPRFAPLFDSARGLFCNEPDDHLSKRYCRAPKERSTELDRYVTRAYPLIGFEGIEPLAGRRFVSHEQVLGAIYQGYPEQRQRIEGILQAYDWAFVRDELRAKLTPLCTPHRLDLILTCLRRRIRRSWAATNPAGC